MDYCLANYVQQLSDTIASRVSDLQKRIAALESKNTIVCTTPVLSLINYTVDITPPIGSIIHYHNINITYSQDAERLWNFVWGGEIGSGTNGQYDAVFTFQTDCVVPNGVENEVTISQLNFKSPNGSKDEYFQGVLIVNNVDLSFSYNRQLVTYTWDQSTATFLMVFDLTALGKNWKNQVKWNTGPPLSPVGGTNSIYANLYLKDDVSPVYMYIYWNHTNDGFLTLPPAFSYESPYSTNLYGSGISQPSWVEIYKLEAQYLEIYLNDNYTLNICVVLPNNCYMNTFSTKIIVRFNVNLQYKIIYNCIVESNLCPTNLVTSVISENTTFTTVEEKIVNNDTPKLNEKSSYTYLDIFVQDRYNCKSCGYESCIFNFYTE
jgi:hypothetical protein